MRDIGQQEMRNRRSQLRPPDLDDQVVDALASVTPDIARRVLADFSQLDGETLREVSNRPAYIMGILRRVVDEEAQAARRQHMRDKHQRRRRSKAKAKRRRSS